MSSSADSRNEDFKKCLLSGKPSRYGQEAYSPDEYGTWRVTGEDPNCDMGGSHHEPDLGTFTGKFKDVVNKAVDLPRFFQWGGGGKIVKITTTSLSAVDNTLVDEISVVQAKAWVVFGNKTTSKAFAEEKEAKDYALEMYQRTGIENLVHKCSVLIHENDKVFLLNEHIGQKGVVSYKPMDPEKLRLAEVKKQALAKLTDEERKLLGL